jgi:hypothetical protein
MMRGCLILGSFLFSKIGYYRYPLEWAQILRMREKGVSH